MERSFRSRLAPIFYIGVLVPAFGLMMVSFFMVEELGAWALLSVAALLVILFMILSRTKYLLTKDHLEIQFVFFKRKIAYERIKKVEFGDHLLFVGLKFATAWKQTIVLNYEGAWEMLISPVQPKKFIQELKQRVPELEIIEK
ncbi:MAG: hypothetical protein EP338_08165 [Bacteroidetes bacterium]|nr:MAG: hypothetical protein EP338_08165 [Bacteroidota bacterium]